jgi:hypothetical protein
MHVCSYKLHLVHPCTVMCCVVLLQVSAPGSVASGGAGSPHLRPRDLPPASWSSHSKICKCLCNEYQQRFQGRFEQARCWARHNLVRFGVSCRLAGCLVRSEACRYATDCSSLPVRDHIRLSLLFILQQNERYRIKVKKTKVRERTIPTERPPFVGEGGANFADRGCNVVSLTHPYGRILGFLGRTETSTEVKINQHDKQVRTLSV